MRKYEATFEDSNLDPFKFESIQTEFYNLEGSYIYQDEEVDLRETSFWYDIVLDEDKHVLKRDHNDFL